MNDTKPQNIVSFFMQNVVGKEVKVNNGESRILESIVVTCDANDINFLVFANGTKFVPWCNVCNLEINEGGCQ